MVGELPIASPGGSADVGPSLYPAALSADFDRQITAVIGGDLALAKNPPAGDGHRIGAVRHRSQVQAPNGNWVKRDAQTGRFIDQKQDGKPFKGVRREK